MDIGQNMNGKDSVAKISSLIEGMASFITAL